MTVPNFCDNCHGELESTAARFVLDSHRLTEDHHAALFWLPETRRVDQEHHLVACSRECAAELSSAQLPPEGEPS